MTCTGLVEKRRRHFLQILRSRSLRSDQPVPYPSGSIWTSFAHGGSSPESNRKWILSDLPEPCANAAISIASSGSWSENSSPSLSEEEEDDELLDEVFELDDEELPGLDFFFGGGTTSSTSLASADRHSGKPRIRHSMILREKESENAFQGEAQVDDGTRPRMSSTRPHRAVFTACSASSFVALSAYNTGILAAFAAASSPLSKAAPDQLPKGIRSCRRSPDAFASVGARRRKEYDVRLRTVPKHSEVPCLETPNAETAHKFVLNEPKLMGPATNFFAEETLADAGQRAGSIQVAFLPNAFSSRLQKVETQPIGKNPLGR